MREIITETLVNMKEPNMKRKRAERLSVRYVEKQMHIKLAWEDKRQEESRQIKCEIFGKRYV